MENEHNQKLSFLDVLVYRVNNQFNSSVYCKLTFTDQGLSFFSHCSVKFQINVLKYYSIEPTTFVPLIWPYIEKLIF